MKLLKEIGDKRFDKSKEIKLREAARAVLIDDEGLTPLLFVSKHNYHKLPGGGIEAGEDKLTALKREVMEEVGCKIKVIGGVGKIIEYRPADLFRSLWHEKQVSYCYFGRVVSCPSKPIFTTEEKAEGFKLVWLPLSQAIETVEQDKPKNIEGRFIQERDLLFLKEVEKLYNQK